VTVEWVTVGAFQENSYLVIDEPSRRAVLVDPGDEAARIIEMVRRSGATVDAVWLTHGHLDHVGAVSAVRREWSVPVLMHADDLPLYRRAAEQAAFYGLPFDQPDDPDQLVQPGDVLTLGSNHFTVRHVPGHSPGHVIFLSDTLMLGGDLLFAGSIGRTDLPLSDPDAMEHSLAGITALDPGVIVYPGHGPPTTIGDELATNPFLAAVTRPANHAR
jgi:hydroxyacylglutathione hydrolase